jgi:hypothetical protein
MCAGYLKTELGFNANIYVDSIPCNWLVIFTVKLVEHVVVGQTLSQSTMVFLSCCYYIWEWIQISQTDAVQIINLTTKRVWKLPTSTQLRATWHTDSLDMVVVPSTGASRYKNCCIDGGISPEYFGYILVCDLRSLLWTPLISNDNLNNFWEITLIHLWVKIIRKLLKTGPPPRAQNLWKTLPPKIMLHMACCFVLTELSLWNLSWRVGEGKVSVRDLKAYGEWRYSSNHSYPWHLINMSGQLCATWRRMGMEV